MKVRRVAPSDKAAMLTSFRPLFGDWDYLPYAIDDWLLPSLSNQTWVACSGPSDTKLVAMVQAAELAPGEWYLNGLRSNPQVRPHQVASAILGLKRAVERELRDKGVARVRYGTLPDNYKSLRLAVLFGFREHFRLGHSWHPLPQVPADVEGIEVTSPQDVSALLDYFRASSALQPVEGYFFTWWDTRRLEKEHLADALRRGLLFVALENSQMVGGAMLWHIPWQKFLVLSIVEGTDDALRTLYRAGIRSARKLECTAIGLVHPSPDEMHRRQMLFGLEASGGYTVQLIHE